MLARTLIALLSLLTMATFAGAQSEWLPSANEVLIGEHFYMDIGLPYNFYEIYVLRSVEDKTDVNRLSLTPPANTCHELSTFAHQQVILDISLTSLLQNRDPCAVTDKQIRKESKRKRGLQFSGSETVMSLSCSGKHRLIPMQFLEEDLFSRNPHSPDAVSWQMSVMAKLNAALGNDVMHSRMLSSEKAKLTPATPDGELEARLRAGDYDSLFRESPGTLARMYVESLVPIKEAEVSLLASSITPLSTSLPTYPPIARAARVDGPLQLRAIVIEGGHLKDVTLLSGSPMLFATSQEALKHWVFPPASNGSEVFISFRFALNCTSQHRDANLPK